MSTAKRVEKLRALMAEKGMDAYVVPTLIFIRASMSANTLRQEIHQRVQRILRNRSHHKG